MTGAVQVTHLFGHDKEGFLSLWEVHVVPRRDIVQNPITSLARSINACCLRTPVSEYSLCCWTKLVLTVFFW